MDNSTDRSLNKKKIENKRLIDKNIEINQKQIKKFYQDYIDPISKSLELNKLSTFFKIKGWCNRASFVYQLFRYKELYKYWSNQKSSSIVWLYGLFASKSGMMSLFVFAWLVIRELLFFLSRYIKPGIISYYGGDFGDAKTFYTPIDFVFIVSPQYTSSTQIILFSICCFLLILCASILFMVTLNNNKVAKNIKDIIESENSELSYKELLSRLRNKYYD